MLPTRTRNQTPQRTFRDPWQAFRDFFEEEWMPEANHGMGAYPVNIHEEDDRIEIEAELPGFKENEINVTMENGVLTISAERQAEEKKTGQTHLQERRFTRVHRQFRVPTGVDEQNVKANLKNGVLHLALHKKEEVKPRKIEVKAG